jgi:anti-sigma regulatory factor (Ser/Thr protein kinase)
MLGTIRLVVGIVARNAGIDEEGIEDLKVAVSESCALAVAEQARAGVDEPVELALIEEGDRFGVEIHDRAPAEVHVPAGDAGIDLDDRQFGLALVGALVEGLESVPLDAGGHRTSFWLRTKIESAD